MPAPFTIEPTQNEAWGFFGTVAASADARAAWDIASRAIATATQCEAWEVRAFLDSRWGRHFADLVVCRTTKRSELQKAIDDTVTTWMGWRITRGDIAELGDGARGLPYLTAYVVAAGIADEAQAPA